MTMSKPLQPTLNSNLLFPSSNPFGFPDLLPQDFILPDFVFDLIKFKAAVDPTLRAASLCHFFLYDAYIESCWTYPTRALFHVKRYWGVLTPDYSMYVGWPAAMQQWNCYRSRWVGRWWQEHSIKVIPTVSWSTPDTWAWCFAGIPQGQVVAVGVPDLRISLTRLFFGLGYRQMRKQLEPSRVLVYGQLPFYDPLATEFPTEVVGLRERVGCTV